ncbi:hypothetical protein GS489_01050 [Rhodococcus hoagii]|nr:hypothetical protein [Prescottella equi]
MTAPGIGGWTESFPEAPILHRLSPPTKVVVNTARVFPGEAGFTRADRLPLRVRAGGIQLEAEMLATLHCWLRLSDGRWVAQVCLPASSVNRHSSLDLWLWVEAAALRPCRKI